MLAYSNVWREAADFVDEVLAQPVVVVDEEALQVVAQVRLQVFFSEHRVRQSLHALRLLELIVALE